MNTPRLYLVGLAAFLLAASMASADSITFVTPSGSSVGDGAVSASSTFTTGAGTLTITLSDLLANPKSVGQLLSDLSFTLSGVTGPISLSSSSGQEIRVNSGGTFTTGSTVSTGWELSQTGANSYLLNVLGTAIGPEHLIIGPPGYSNANGSIAGNGPHNPFLNQTATFNITGAGITANSTVTGAVFSFGTTEGVTVRGVPPGATPVPEPAGLALMGAGLTVAAGILHRRMKR